MADEFEPWEPYRPPWYTGPHLNPWATDPATYQQGHETFYRTWVKSLAPGESERLIAESKSCQTTVFLDAKKKRDLYLWLAHSPSGPSVKFNVVNV